MNKKQFEVQSLSVLIQQDPPKRVGYLTHLRANLLGFSAKKSADWPSASSGGHEIMTGYPNTMFL